MRGGAGPGRSAAAGAALAVVALLSGCGSGASTDPAAMAELRSAVAEVRPLVEAAEFDEARTVVSQVRDDAQRLYDAGRLSDEDADEVVEAAEAVLADLPEETVETPTETPTETATETETVAPEPPQETPTTSAPAPSPTSGGDDDDDDDGGDDDSSGGGGGNGNAGGGNGNAGGGNGGPGNGNQGNQGNQGQGGGSDG